MTPFIMRIALMSSGAPSDSVKPAIYDTPTVSANGRTVTISISEDGDEAALDPGDFALSDTNAGAVSAAVWTNATTITLTVGLPAISDQETPTLSISADAFFDLSGNGNAVVTSQALANNSAAMHIPPDALVAVRSDVGVTLSGADVTAWLDQSGAANDYGNAGIGTYPQYDTATWGAPALTAPDTVRRLIGDPGIASALTGNDSTWTIYGLIYRPTTGSSRYWGVGDASRYLRLNTGGTAELSVVKLGAGGVPITVTTSAVFGVGWHVVCVRCHGATVDIFVDSTTANVSGAAFSDDLTGATTDHTIFARPPTSGGIGSIAAWIVSDDADDVTDTLNSLLTYMATL